MTQAPYRISYTQAPDGKVTIAVDISGPLPDPLAGMSAEERRAVSRQRLSLSEYVTLWSVRRLPAAARHVVWLQILARRRQAFLQRTALMDKAPVEPEPMKAMPPDSPIVAEAAEMDREPEMGM